MWYCLPGREAHVTARAECQAFVTEVQRRGAGQCVDMLLFPAVPMAGLGARARRQFKQAEANLRDHADVGKGAAPYLSVCAGIPRLPWHIALVHGAFEHVFELLQEHRSDRLHAGPVCAYSPSSGGSSPGTSTGSWR